MHTIRMEKQGLTLETNGGDFANSCTAESPYSPERVWYNPNSVANILSLALLVKHFRVTFDSQIENAFVVHTPKGNYKFTWMVGNIYALAPTKSMSHAMAHLQASFHQGEANFQLLETVKERESYYTKKQVSRARRAREFVFALGHPTIKDARNIIKMNAIKDCPITEADLMLAAKIFGPDVSSLKGKITRTKQVQVKQSVVSIPDELIKAQKQVDLCIDTFFVNQMPFLSTISRRIYYRTCQWIKSREVDTYQECFIKVLKLYKSAGFQVATVSADREFVAVLDPIKEKYKFTTNYASAQEHVPEVERSNRVIKERVRATVHRSPYACLPRTVLKFVVTEAARKLNFFPAQYGCSAYYSPRQILHHVNLHYQHQSKQIIQMELKTNQ
jgi:hypothetical protein